MLSPIRDSLAPRGGVERTAPEELMYDALPVGLFEEGVEGLFEEGGRFGGFVAMVDGGLERFR